MLPPRRFQESGAIVPSRVWSEQCKTSSACRTPASPRQTPSPAWESGCGHGSFSPTPPPPRHQPGSGASPPALPPGPDPQGPRHGETSVSRPPSPTPSSLFPTTPLCAGPCTLGTPTPLLDSFFSEPANSSSSAELSARPDPGHCRYSTGSHPPLFLNSPSDSRDRAETGPPVRSPARSSDIHRS